MALFDQARETLRGMKVKCELTFHKDYGRMLENLAQDRNYYDVWILDARDPDCLEQGRRLRSVNLTAAIVFLDRDLSQLDALLWLRPSALIPVDQTQEKLPQVLTQCCNEQLRNLRYFTIKNKDGLLRISFEDILFIESRQRLAIMHTRRQTIEFYAKLSDVIQQLPGDMFVHCHQSYIVNMRRVSKLDKSNRCFILTTGTAVEISKSNYSQVVAQYSGYVGN